MANTTVDLNGAIPGGASPAAARSRPLPVTPDEPLAAAPMPQYQPRYNDRPLLPFPFFFGR